MSDAPPPPTDVAIQAAARLLAEGRPGEAVARLSALVDEAPTYAAAHVLLASALDASGRPTDALEVWRRAAFLVPNSPLVDRERQRLMASQHADSDTTRPEGHAEDTPAEQRHDTAVETAPPESTDALGPALAATEASPHDEPGGAPDAAVRDAQPVLPPEDVSDDEPREETTSPDTAPATQTEDDGWTLIEDAPAHAASSSDPAPAAILPPDLPEPSAASAEPIVEASIVERSEDLADLAEAIPQSEPEDEASVEDAATPPHADDLDDLISQLDAAPRIKPDPEFDGPAVTFDNAGVDDMVSETLAKIYAAQHQYVEAALVYEKLADREPEQASAHLQRAAELREKAG